MLKFHCIELESGLIDPDDICGSRECPDFYSCVKGLDNPNSGATSFDNILLALLAVF